MLELKRGDNKLCVNLVRCPPEIKQLVQLKSLEVEIKKLSYFFNRIDAVEYVVFVKFDRENRN